jgi:hypothetical protein
MKIHVHINDEDALSGYIDICLGQVQDRDGELDAHVEDAEANEIILNNTLEFIPLPELTGFLTHVVKKLRHGGSLIVTGVDALSVAKDYSQYKMSIEDFNILLHGNQQDANNIKTATLTLHGMCNFLANDFGLKIIRKGLEDYNYVIEAQRP